MWAKPSPLYVRETYDHRDVEGSCNHSCISKEEPVQESPALQISQKFNGGSSSNCPGRCSWAEAATWCRASSRDQLQLLFPRHFLSGNKLSPPNFSANLKRPLKPTIPIAVDTQTQKSNPTTQGAATPRLSRGTVIAVAVSYLSLHRGIAVQSDVTIQPAWEQELDASNALTTLSQKPPVEENESECSISTSSRGNPATIPCQASRKKMQTEWCQGCNLECREKWTAFYSI